MFHSFKPCRRQQKQTNAQALQTSSNNKLKIRIRAIYCWYYNTRSSPADLKQNKRSRVYHRKIQKFSNYPPFRNDANFGNYPDAAGVTIRYNQSRKITSSKCNIFATSPLSRRASIGVHVEVPGGQRWAKGAGAGPRRLLRAPFVQAPQTSSKKKKNAPALQTSSKTNALEYATAKFKTLATNNRLEMMPTV